MANGSVIPHIVAVHDFGRTEMRERGERERGEK